MNLKRKGATLILATTLATSFAMGDDTYKGLAGLEIGSTESTYEYHDNKIDTNNVACYGMRAGIANNRSRIYGSFHYMKDDGSGDNYSFDYKQYDLVLNLEAQTDAFNVLDKFNVRGFVGAHIGAVYAKFKYSDSFIHINDDQTGVAYGAQGGAIFNFNNNFDLEAGYRYTWSSLDFQGVDLDHYDNIYAAVNIHF